MAEGFLANEVTTTQSNCIKDTATRRRVDGEYRSRVKNVKGEIEEGSGAHVALGQHEEQKVARENPSA